MWQIHINNSFFFNTDIKFSVYHLFSCSQGRLLTQGSSLIVQTQQQAWSSMFWPLRLCERLQAHLLF